MKTNNGLNSDITKWLTIQGNNNNTADCSEIDNLTASIFDYDSVQTIDNQGKASVKQQYDQNAISNVTESLASLQSQYGAAIAHFNNCQLNLANFEFDTDKDGNPTEESLQQQAKLAADLQAAIEQANQIQALCNQTAEALQNEREALNNVAESATQLLSLGLSIDEFQEIITQTQSDFDTAKAKAEQEILAADENNGDNGFNIENGKIVLSGNTVDGEKVTYKDTSDGTVVAQYNDNETAYKTFLDKNKEVQTVAQENGQTNQPTNLNYFELAQENSEGFYSQDNLVYDDKTGRYAIVSNWGPESYGWNVITKLFGFKFNDPASTDIWRIMGGIKGQPSAMSFCVDESGFIATASIDAGNIYLPNTQDIIDYYKDINKIPQNIRNLYNITEADFIDLTSALEEAKNMPEDSESAATPSEAPSEAPSEVPSEVPSEIPSEAQSEVPNEAPNEASSEVPSATQSAETADANQVTLPLINPQKIDRMNEKYDELIQEYMNNLESGYLEGLFSKLEGNDEEILAVREQYNTDGVSLIGDIISNGIKLENLLSQAKETKETISTKIYELAESARIIMQAVGKQAANTGHIENAIDDGSELFDNPDSEVSAFGINGLFAGLAGNNGIFIEVVDAINNKLNDSSAVINALVHNAQVVEDTVSSYAQARAGYLVEHPEETKQQTGDEVQVALNAGTQNGAIYASTIFDDTQALAITEATQNGGRYEFIPDTETYAQVGISYNASHVALAFDPDAKSNDRYKGCFSGLNSYNSDFIFRNIDDGGDSDEFFTADELVAIVNQVEDATVLTPQTDPKKAQLLGKMLASTMYVGNIDSATQAALKELRGAVSPESHVTGYAQGLFENLQDKYEEFLNLRDKYNTDSSDLVTDMITVDETEAVQAVFNIEAKGVLDNNAQAQEAIKQDLLTAFRNITYPAGQAGITTAFGMLSLKADKLVEIVDEINEASGEDSTVINALVQDDELKDAAIKLAQARTEDTLGAIEKATGDDSQMKDSYKAWADRKTEQYILELEAALEKDTISGAAYAETGFSNPNVVTMYIDNKGSETLHELVPHSDDYSNVGIYINGYETAYGLDPDDYDSEAYLQYYKHINEYNIENLEKDIETLEPEQIVAICNQIQETSILDYINPTYSIKVAESLVDTMLSDNEELQAQATQALAKEVLRTVIVDEINYDFLNEIFFNYCLKTGEEAESLKTIVLSQFDNIDTKNFVETELGNFLSTYSYAYDSLNDAYNLANAYLKNPTEGNIENIVDKAMEYHAIEDEQFIYQVEFVLRKDEDLIQKVKDALELKLQEQQKEEEARQELEKEQQKQQELDKIHSEIIKKNDLYDVNKLSAKFNDGTLNVNDLIEIIRKHEDYIDLNCSGVNKTASQDLAIRLANEITTGESSKEDVAHVIADCLYMSIKGSGNNQTFVKTILESLEGQDEIIQMIYNEFHLRDDDDLIKWIEDDIWSIGAQKRFIGIIKNAVPEEERLKK